MAQVHRRWAGIMDGTRDGEPMIGARLGRPGQWIIAGFGGHGLPVALGAGKALAEAIVRGKPPDVLNAYDPARLAAG